MKLLGLRGLGALLLSLGALAALPAIAQAADTFADASQPNNNGDCLTPATACQTITGANGALAKASPGSTVRVEPGTYAENVTLSGGISLVAAAGNPVIAPTTGAGVTVTGAPAVTVRGLTFASDADGPELLLGDGAGSVLVTANNFIDRAPSGGGSPEGVRTTSKGAPQITGNGFTLLQHGVQVLSPAAGVPGTPLISGNTIIATPDFGTGITVRSTDTQGVTAPTTAALVGNEIEQGDGDSTGVLVVDGGSVVGDPSIPGAGLTMSRNRILGGGDGLRDFGARAPVTLFGDVIARTGSVSPGQVVHSAIKANANASLGGDLTVTNTDLVDNADPAIQLADNHLTLDSSIVTGSISQAPEGASGCTITFSAGPTTSGNSCQTFQANPPARFNDQEVIDIHLDPALDLALIDHGNPEAPPAGATDLDGDARALDGDGACPLLPIRDIGADEFNPGSSSCPPPEPPPGGGLSGAPPAGGVQASAPPTGLRAAALKKCKRRHGRARTKCARRARRLPR